MNKYLLKYNDLKEKDAATVYFFRKGIFYIALLDDAVFMNNEFKLSLFHPFSNNINGAGFPVKSLNDYKRKLYNKKIKYEIIEFEKSSKESYLEKPNNEKIIEKINNLELSQTTPMEAFNFLYNIQKELKKY